MSCKICGRNSCCPSFHSLAEQEEFDTKTGRFAPKEPEKPIANQIEVTNTDGNGIQ